MIKTLSAIDAINRPPSKCENFPPKTIKIHREGNPRDKVGNVKPTSKRRHYHKVKKDDMIKVLEHFNVLLNDTNERRLISQSARRRGDHVTGTTNKGDIIGWLNHLQEYDNYKNVILIRLDGFLNGNQNNKTSLYANIARADSANLSYYLGAKLNAPIKNHLLATDNKSLDLTITNAFIIEDDPDSIQVIEGRDQFTIDQPIGLGFDPMIVNSDNLIELYV